jgi:hypothetical protein
MSRECLPVLTGPLPVILRPSRLRGRRTATRAFQTLWTGPSAGTLWVPLSMAGTPLRVPVLL